MRPRMKKIAFGQPTRNYKIILNNYLIKHTIMAITKETFRTLIHEGQEAI